MRPEIRVNRMNVWPERSAEMEARGRARRQDERKPRGIPEVTDLDAELTGLKEAHTYSLQTLGGLSDEDLARPTDWGGKKRTTLEFFLLVFEHDAQHRGQVATYLRLLGVERPAGRDWRGLVYGR